MAKDNFIFNDIKTKLENIHVNIKNIDKNIKKIESHGAKIKNELTRKNLPKKKYTIADVLPIVIALFSFFIACYSVYSSNKLSINNSSLNFVYKKIDIITPKEKVPIHVAPGDKNDQGAMDICVSTEVISGQIASLYLIQKQNDNFVFTLLNEDVQDKYSKIKEYNAEIFLDLKEKGQYKDKPIGEGILYILSEDIHGKIDIDVIQIIGFIVKKYTVDESGEITVMVYQPSEDYSFRYLKNNKLVTLDDKYEINDNIDDNWINLSDTYLDIIENLKETDFKTIKEDISAIREKYSDY